MGKHKNATKGGSDCQKGISPTPLSHVGGAGDTGDVVHDLASSEEAWSQMGTSSKMPFCFVQCRRSLSEWSSSPEHQQNNLAQAYRTCYCVWVKETLGEGGGDQPPPPHVWTGLVISNMLHDGLEEQITKAVVWAPGEMILVFGWWSLKEGLPLDDVRHAGFCLGNPVNWPGTEA